MAKEKEGMGCLGWLIVGVVCWIMYKYFIPSGGLLDNSAMEKPVTKAYEAIAAGNYDDYKNQFIDLTTDDDTSVLYYYNTEEYIKAYYYSMSEVLKENFGNDLKIKETEVVDREKYDVTELGELSKIMTAAKNEFTAITDIYALYINITVSGSDKTETYHTVAIVAKINWKWKCLLILDKYQMDQFMAQDNENNIDQTSLISDTHTKESAFKAETVKLLNSEERIFYKISKTPLQNKKCVL